MSTQAVAALYYRAGEKALRAARAYADGRWTDAGAYEDESRDIARLAGEMWDALPIQHTHAGYPWSPWEETQRAIDEAHGLGYRDGWRANESIRRMGGVMKYDIGTPHGPMVVTIPRGHGPVTLTPGVSVTVVQAPAILHTPEGTPYSTDPEIMAALDLRHRIGYAEGAEHVAHMLSEGLMGEQHEMTTEQETGYQHAADDAHDAAHGARSRVSKS